MGRMSSLDVARRLPPASRWGLLADSGSKRDRRRLPGVQHQLLSESELTPAGIFQPETLAGNYLGRLAPYFDLPWRRSFTPAVSKVPRIMW